MGPGVIPSLNRLLPLLCMSESLPLTTKLMGGPSLPGDAAVVPGGHRGHLPGLHQRRVGGPELGVVVF